MTCGGYIRVIACVVTVGWLTSPSTALATARTWDGGGGDNNWSTTGNWSGDTVPVAADTVTFDSTSTKACTMDADVKIASLTIATGYSGTITPSAGKTLQITGNYSQSRGTMNAAASTLVGGTFTLDGTSTATFNAGSGTVIIDGAYTQSTGTTTFNGNTAYIVFGDTMTKSAGTFTPNTSSILLAGTTNANVPLGSFSTLRIEDPTESHLVAHFKLDEATGISVHDYSGNALDATIAGSTLPTWKTTSLQGLDFNNRSALTFVYTGTDLNQAVSFTTTTNWNPITVAAWIYIPSADDGQGNPRIVDLPHFRVYTNASSKIGVYSDRMGAACYGGSGTGDGNWQTSTAYTRDAWHHVAVTYTAESASPYTNLPKVYLDGALIASVAGDYSLNTAPTVTTLCAAGTGTIGNSNPNADNLNGSVDDVRIYDTELSLSQIQNLHNGGYANPTGSTRTSTLTAVTTVSSLLSLYRGTLLTGSNNLTASDGTQAATFDLGGLTVGAATARFDGGATFNDNTTLTMKTSGGVVSIGSGKTLTVNSTLDASDSTAVPTIQAVSGNYAFAIGSTSTATPTLNINGLNVSGTDTNGMYINSYGAAGPVTTFTKFDSLHFSAGVNTSGATLLRIYATSLYLTSNGSSFNRNNMHATSYNVKLTGDNSSANGETRAIFGNTTCTSNANASETCESNDSDNDSTNDGVADSTGGGVVQFVKQAYSESQGSIQGFPTASFNWSTFAYWRTYAAFNNDDGANTNTLYARDDSGSSAAYTWSIPASEGTFVGAPRWDMESGTHYVFIVTSSGYVYKLTDNGTSLAVVSGYPYHNTTGGASATATSPLVMDSTSLYFSGKDGGGSNRKIFRVTRSSGALNGTPKAVSADINGGLAMATVSATPYLFAASNLNGMNGKVYKLSTDLATEYGSSNGQQSTTNISGRLSIYSNVIYFAEDKGKIWGIDTTDNLATVWSYQDTGSGHGACSSSSDCTVKALYLEPKSGRVYYGDQDGHIYIVTRNGAGGSLYSGYPVRPTGGSTTDPFVTPPVYLNGAAAGSGTNPGVIAIGSSTGKVFFMDQQNGSAAPALIRMFHTGSAVSAIAYRYASSSAGVFMVSTANGRTLYIDSADVVDPTPNNN